MRLRATLPLMFFNRQTGSRPLYLNNDDNYALFARLPRSLFFACLPCDVRPIQTFDFNRSFHHSPVLDQSSQQRTANNALHPGLKSKSDFIGSGAAVVVVNNKGALNPGKTERCSQKYDGDGRLNKGQQ